MPPRELPHLHRVLADIQRMYGSQDASAGDLRAAHLRAVLRLTPFMMAANAGSALLLALALATTPPPGLWVWLVTLLGLVALGLRGWWGQTRRERPMASRRALGRATLHAGLLALWWGSTTAAWFPQISASQQLVMATLLTGMLGAGSFVLSALPRASLAWNGVLTLGGVAALLQGDDHVHQLLAVLLLLYAGIVAIGAVSAWHKSTALIRARAESARQERMLSLLLQDFEQNADEALWEVATDGRLSHASPRLAELLGLDRGQLDSSPFLPLLQRLSPQAAGRLEDAFADTRPFRDLLLPLQSQGETRHLAINGKRLLDDQGHTQGWRGVLADVSERVRAEERLHQLAHTDSLTGLANRFMLRDALSRATRQGSPGALVIIDLDHFKSVNDSMGHAMGDAVLKAVAKRLRTCVRPADLVARLGGDEFAILTSGNEAPPEQLAQRVVDTLAEPLYLNGRRLRVGGSVGLALCGEDGAGVDELLVRADTALYASKAAGRGRQTLYTTPMGESNRRRLLLEEGLRMAIENGQLSMHWQPRVDLADWRITGVECLMRWTHPELGRVPPGEFIAVAEQTGLIDKLGRWALEQACQAAAGPLADLVVSVNVSPLQLRDAPFFGHVRDALRASGIEPDRLELEITESVFMDDADGALRQLHAVRGLGVRVALDDFGTGYSSLAYLRRFPFDTLKIDRAFIREVLAHKDARAIVVAISQLAGILGMRTVCEGVEEEEQLRVAARAGCHEVQGYLVTPPLPLQDLLPLLAQWADRPRLAQPVT
jgi:diguanylate cyclase (GGDEF)-like protein/PAS domain S-box-containing protein